MHELGARLIWRNDSSEAKVIQSASTLSDKTHITCNWAHKLTGMMVMAMRTSHGWLYRLLWPFCLRCHHPLPPPPPPPEKTRQDWVDNTNELYSHLVMKSGIPTTSVSGMASAAVRRPTRAPTLLFAAGRHAPQTHSLSLSAQVCS